MKAWPICCFLLLGGHMKNGWTNSTQTVYICLLLKYIRSDTMSTEVGVASMQGIPPGPNAKRNVCGESYKANNLNSIVAIESPDGNR